MRSSKKAHLALAGGGSIRGRHGGLRILAAGLAVICALFLLSATVNPHIASAQSGDSSSGTAGILADSENTNNEPQTDQIMIKFRVEPAQAGQFELSNAGEIERLSHAAGVGLAYFRAMSGGAYVLKLPSHMSQTAVLQITERLKKLAEVESAEPDAILQPALEPNDPYYGTSQWNLKPVSVVNYGIDAPAAWNFTTGSSGVVVAVVDTGITTHPEFAERTLPGYDFISNVLTANDGDARDADPSDPGDWITSTESADPKGSFYLCAIAYSSWHGTHTTGIIAAMGNNGLGVAGINWNSKILPVRVLGKCGGSTSDVIDGMRWAAGIAVQGVPNNPNPAKVINASLGGKVPCDSFMQNAINEIIAKGTTVVVSAGNDGADASISAPGSCAGVITVAAINQSGSRATYSNFGSVVEISAPGGDGSYTGSIFSTWNSGSTTPGTPSYSPMYGTSMAAPHVSGVASLLYSLNPAYTPSQILNILQNSATPFPVGSTCNTSNCGRGIVNAGGAVQTPVITSLTPDHVLTGSGNLTLTVNGSNFYSNSVIQWNGVDLATTFVGSNQLTATIPAEKVASIGQANITAANRISGEYISNVLAFGIHTFEDVVPGSWYYRYTEGLYAQGVTSGCADNPLRYCPANAVTRAQMAKFLLLAKYGKDYVPPAASGSLFRDVPATYWAAAWIEQLAAEGITSGCAANLYCPNNPVTRAQMAIFLLKAKGLTEEDLLPATGSLFDDVPATHWAAKWIEELFREGITSGCTPTTYCPLNSVTRAQMAVFLDQAFGFPQLP